MHERQLQLQYEHPLSGDIIFVASTRGKHAVKTYQKAFQKPHPDIVHVAAVVTPIDFIETNFRKHAFTMTPNEWRANRRECDTYRILRRTDLSITRKQEAMTEAGAYFLNEEYNIMDVLS
ncbi:MAG: hypothetical protein AAF416_21375, partial [Pseudomonadota bacterium]